MTEQCVCFGLREFKLTNEHLSSKERNGLTSQTGGKKMKTKVVTAGTVLCIVGLVLCGCVSTQKYTQAQSEIEALSMDKDKLAAQNADLTAKLAGAQKERNTLADQVVELKVQLKAAQDNTAAAEGKAASLQGQIDEKEAQIKVLNTKIEDLTGQVDALKKENEDLKSKLAPAPAPEPTPAPTLAPGAE